MDLMMEQMCALNLPEPLARQAVCLLRRNPEVTSLVTDRTLGTLPSTTLLRMVQVARQVLDLERGIAASRLPVKWLDHVRSASHLALLKGFPDLPDCSGAEVAGLAMALLKEGMQSATIHAAAHPDAGPELKLQALGEVGSSRPHELPQQRWLAWHRLELTGGLTLKFEIDREPLERQVLARPALALDKALVALLEPALTDALRTELKERAVAAVLAEAVPLIEDLLLAPPLKDRPLLSVFVGTHHQPIAAVVVDAANRVVDAQRFPDTAEWKARFKQFVAAMQPAASVVPLTSVDASRLREVRLLLPGRTVSVRPAGLSTARSHFKARQPGLDRETLSAWILGHRVIHPWEAWSPLPCEQLGLVEYAQDLSSASLWELLEQVKTLLRVPGRRALSPEKPPLTAGPVGVKKSVLIGEMGQLRPGMIIECQVSNIATFGAFVDLGLPEEGLIHISQLATQRVDRVSDVVHLGQVLKARVLEVDVPRHRISLSLILDAPETRNGKSTKAKALKALNDLFR